MYIHWVCALYTIKIFRVTLNPNKKKKTSREKKRDKYFSWMIINFRKKLLLIIKRFCSGYCNLKKKFYGWIGRGMRGRRDRGKKKKKWKRYKIKKAANVSEWGTADEQLPRSRWRTFYFLCPHNPHVFKQFFFIFSLLLSHHQPSIFSVASLERKKEKEKKERERRVYE